MPNRTLEDISLGTDLVSETGTVGADGYQALLNLTESNNKDGYYNQQLDITDINSTYYRIGYDAGYAIGYQTGYNKGSSTSSLSQYGISINTIDVKQTNGVAAGASFGNGAIWTAPGNGNLRVTFASGYYYYDPDQTNHQGNHNIWYSSPWVSMTIYGSNGAVKYTRMSVAADGGSCRNGPTLSYDLKRGDYIVFSGRNPSNQHAGAYLYGTYAYAVMN